MLQDKEYAFDVGVVTMFMGMIIIGLGLIYVSYAVTPQEDGG